MEDYGRIRGIKRGHPKMKEIDNTTKIIAIIVIAIVVYLLSFLVLRNIFAGDLNTIQHMAERAYYGEVGLGIQQHRDTFAYVAVVVEKCNA